MKKLIMGLMILSLSAVVPAAAELKVITAASDPYPPFVDPKHPKEGLSLEIVRAAFKTQGYEVKMSIMPWARAEAEVKKGTYDILPDVWMTDARKKDFMFGKPYVSNKVKFVFLKENRFEYDGMKSLEGKKVGTVRGYGYSDEFLKADKFKREEVADFMTNIRKLIAKRLDLTLEDELVAKAQIAKEDPKILDQIRFTANSFSVNDLHVASGIKNPRHKEIIEAFNKGLEIIKADGTAARILASYGLK